MAEGDLSLGVIVLRATEVTQQPEGMGPRKKKIHIAYMYTGYWFALRVNHGLSQLVLVDLG